MKNFLLANFLMIGVSAFAQTYCIPAFASGCNGGDQINSFTIPGAGFSHLDTGCSQEAYGDYTTQTINLSAGVNYPFSITHAYEEQNVRIWIDFNNDGTFEDAAPELVTEASSTGLGSNAVTNGTVNIPLTAVPGNYRMRVGDRFSSQPIPCNTSGYGEIHDYMVAIGAPPSCLAPSNLVASSITSISANVEWTASASTVGVGYEYYLSTSSTAPDGSTVATGNVGASSTSVPLSSLASATDYYVWVRSVCTTTDKSIWSPELMFTTECAAVIPDYTNDFSTFPGNCWSQASDGSPSTGPSGTDEYWSEGGFLNSGDEGAAKINIFSLSFFPISIVGWLKTTEFDLSAGNYRVKFDFGVTEYGETAASAMGSDDVVEFVVSTDGGNTWTVLQTWNAANAPSNTSNTYTLDLTGYTSPNTVFAFYGSNGTVDDTEDYEFFVDNFVVETATLATSEVSGNKNSIKAYPNPFSDVLNISDVAKVKSISISDVSGRLVKTIESPNSTLHLEDLKSGMYIMALNMKDGSRQVTKIIKK